jgi:hypothetical protein
MIGHRYRTAPRSPIHLGHIHHHAQVLIERLARRPAPDGAAASAVSADAALIAPLGQDAPPRSRAPREVCGAHRG